MTLQNSDINNQSINIEPTVLVDETSNTEYYIGISNNFNVGTRANWRIKRIWKDGNIWKAGYPNGDQGFTFIWNDRYGYTYS